eukprot:COSAG02_NODE_42197_length_386_cov_2.226481_2_plen_26_part_01
MATNTKNQVLDCLDFIEIVQQPALLL